MKYIISVFYDDAEVTVKTNDVEIAILEMLRADSTGNHAHVQDGETGEVLALVNHPDQFMTAEFSLMVLGFLVKCEQAQTEEEEVEVEPEEEYPDYTPEEEPAVCAEDAVRNLLIELMGGLPS